MKARLHILFLVVGVGLSVAAFGQFRDIGFEVGAGGGVVLDNSGSDNVAPGTLIRACLAYPLSNPFQAEFGYAYAELIAKDIHTIMMPIDLRLKFSPFHVGGVTPYLYAGGGFLNYSYHNQPDNLPPDVKHTAWVPFVPAGAGVQIRLDEYFSLELQGGYNQTFSADVTPEVVSNSDNDSYITALAGLRVGGGPRNPDLDGDGLLNKDEKRLGTDPKNPDTDGDGLKDGEEHFTYNTNPLVADTDGDGLTDGAEVLTHKTDPLKPDTDGDGLNDGAEVNQYTTNPLMADTDGDTLNDGAEVTQYKTDPLKADTDGGTVADGVEVGRGTNPLDPSDDLPKKQLIVFEKNKPVILPGITFEFNSAKIRPESEETLNTAFESLQANPEVNVEIGGHTDSKGSDAYNHKLSHERAESVKAWLVAKGISADRITTKGYGESKPIADNKTDEGRAQNRRIEFTRTN